MATTIGMNYSLCGVRQCIIVKRLLQTVVGKLLMRVPARCCPDNLSIETVH